jgi:hypothetical protein
MLEIPLCSLATPLKLKELPISTIFKTEIVEPIIISLKILAHEPILVMPLRLTQEPIEA